MKDLGNILMVTGVIIIAFAIWGFIQTMITKLKK